MAKRKPPKPSPDFPLFAHNNGQWAKKIKGKLHYFGLWGSPEAALDNYLNRDPEASTDRERAPQLNVPARTRPVKPHKDFPLYAHASGRWAKKIRGKTHYFGPWDKPQEALELWLVEREDLLAGRTPPRSAADLTILDLLNAFLTNQQRRMDTRELAQQSWDDYLAVCKRIAAALGGKRILADLCASDFEKLRTEFTKCRGTTPLPETILSRVRAVFNWGHSKGFVDWPLEIWQYREA